MKSRIPASHTRGAALLSVLAALVIIAVLFAFLYGRGFRNNTTATRPGGPTTTVGMGLESGRAVDCSNNLSQIRYAIGLERMNDPDTATLPPNLEVLSRNGISPQMRKCPVSNQPYQYDPRTGKV
ncbi:MAG TPA: hypothetical protein PKK84_01620, partial [Armatimonadota bacterium]|nr:hypothetical protein [Armatimonadota bacterium]